jgi:hypothetical protein
MEDHREYNILAAVTNEGDYLEFKKGATVTDSTVAGALKEGGFVEIPIEQVKMVYVRTVDPATTCIAAIGVSSLLIGVAFLIVLATKECCPFIYCYDGEQYIFDGEPYGGAICEAFQRTDLCRLEHLQPVNGEYRIQLVNEVDETQHTNEFKLWIVDHPPEINVMQDAANNLYSITALHKPLSAVNSRGEDLYKWIEEKDMLWWESDVRYRDPESSTDLRDTLYLNFSRPPGTKEAKFVVHGCNTLWASQMLIRMVGLFGGYVRRFYDKMKDPNVVNQKGDWDNWTEIYALNVDVWSNDGWSRSNKILGGGPFMAEQRVVLLDLEGIEGDTLKIRISPPVGFWQFNSFAVDYSEPVAFEMEEISASSIFADNGRDLLSVLEATDDDFHVMPEVGQRAYLTFAVPELKAGNERTIFAKASGYYEMHLNASGSPQFEKIHRILSEPDYVVEFSLKEYQKWLSEHMSMR